jgi:uncharacterized protein YlxW (UPF0749 family)
MKGIVKKQVVLAAGIVFVIMLIAGCEEQNVPNAKKSRLVAAENMQLKKELNQLGVKLEQRNREIEKQKGLLDKCLQEKKTLEEKVNENVEELVGGIMDIFTEENARLQKEIDRLKKEVEKFKNPR